MFHFLNDLEPQLYNVLNKYDALLNYYDDKQEHFPELKRLLSLIETELPRKLTLLVLGLHLVNEYRLNFEPKPPFYQVSLEKVCHSLNEDFLIWQTAYEQYGNLQDVRLVLNSLQFDFLELDRLYLYIMSLKCLPQK